MSITIKTHLNSGIYASCGGGETRTRYEWVTGPRNLAAAVDQFFEHLRAMSRSYGNIGCGSSWVEIDGVRIHHADMHDLLEGDDPREFDRMYSTLTAKSRTQKCREFIEYVRTGGYASDQRAIEAAQESGEFDF